MGDDKPKAKQGGFGNPFGGRGAGVEKAKDFRGSIARLLKYMNKYVVFLVLAMACAGAGAIFFVLGPKRMGRATTILAEGIMKKVSGNGGIDFSTIGRILIVVIILYSIGAVFMMLQSLIMAMVTQKIAFSLRQDISQKINRMPLGYFESKATGDVLSTVTNDVDTIGTSLSQTFTTVVQSAASIIGTLIMMLTISPIMTLIAVVMLPVSAGLIAFTVKRSQGYFKEQQEKLEA